MRCGCGYNMCITECVIRKIYLQKMKRNQSIPKKNLCLSYKRVNLEKHNHSIWERQIHLQGHEMQHGLGMLQTCTRFQFVVHVPCMSEETKE